MGSPTLFSPDYRLARQRFRDAARAAGFALEEHPIEQEGPRGEVLTIDVARKGPPRPRSVLAVSSGTHGVEGFFGSAVQLAWLESGAALPAEDAALLIHAVNPFGFAWVRRVNEDNVDLNRNFLCAGQTYEGCDPGYREVEALLNPPTPPGGFEAFYARTLWAIATRGLGTMKAAMVSGQYAYPKGLFFGGSGPSRSQQILGEHYPRWVGGAQRLVQIDLHTGLGAFGSHVLAIEAPDPGEKVERLRRTFGDDVHGLDPSGVLYPIRGVLGDWVEERLPGTDVACMLAEFGTHPILRVLAALRAENRVWHWGDRETPAGRRAVADFKEAFCPASGRWRSSVVASGLDILAQAGAALAR